MKGPDKIKGLVTIAVIFIAMMVFLIARIHATGDDAHLSAESISLEKTDDGAILTLEGPVEVIYMGDRLNADSAVVTLQDGMESLSEAITGVELVGNASYTGTDGARASSANATFHSQGRRLVLTGGVRFTRSDFTASAGRVDYSIVSKQASFSGGCTLDAGDIRAECQTADYDLATETGTVSGGVTVHYATSGTLFGDMPIDEVIMRASQLHLFVGEGEIRTPTEADRTTLEAGGFTLTADSMVFRANELGLKLITAEGSVVVTGPDISVTAESISFSNGDRILKAEGGVSFTVMGQGGSADALEVNFAEDWSVRLTGASIGGTVEELEEVLENGVNSNGESSDGSE